LDPSSINRTTRLTFVWARATTQNCAEPVIMAHLFRFRNPSRLKSINAANLEVSFYACVYLF